MPARHCQQTQLPIAAGRANAPRGVRRNRARSLVGRGRVPASRWSSLVVVCGLVLLGAQGLCARAYAQYPARGLRVITNVPPGGAPDIAARVLANGLSGALGRAVVVENHPGANGGIAVELAARSQPDGYTLLVCADSQIVINPQIYLHASVDPQRDLMPLATLAQNMFVLSIHPSVPVRDFAGFIDYARTVRPPMAYATAGDGSQHQMAMESLKQRAGIELLHVPYRGGAPAAMATVAGEVQAMFAGTSNAPQIQAGALRALAVTGAQRSPSFPTLPTIGEFYPGYEITIWLGIFGPTGIPAPVVDRLRSEIKRLLNSPDTRQALNRAGGLEPFITTPEQFAVLIQRDYQRYGELIRRLGLTAR